MRASEYENTYLQSRYFQLATSLRKQSNQPFTIYKKYAVYLKAQTPMHECNSFKNTKLAVYEQDRKMYRYVLCKQNNDLNSTKAPKLMKAIFHGCYSTKPISRKKIPSYEKTLQVKIHLYRTHWQNI